MDHVYKDGERVEHIQTGAEGTIVDASQGEVQVSWDANEHGGYVDWHYYHEIRPA